MRKMLADLLMPEENNNSRSSELTPNAIKLQQKTEEISECESRIKNLPDELVN